MAKTKSVFMFFIAFAAGMMIAVAGGKGIALAAGPAGTKLPADGGEPGKDYMKYLTALQKKDGATIRKMAEIPAGTSDTRTCKARCR